MPLALLLLGGIPVVAGCPANTCFLEICDGKDCRCSFNTCTEGADFDTNTRRCRCHPGTFDIAGQCLTQNQANNYCGVGYGWLASPDGRSGCVKLVCRPGDQMDERTGMCIPSQQVGAQNGVQLGQGQKLGCAPNEVLVVNAGQAACVPAEQSCAKDEVWTGSGCQKTGTCATGETFDPAAGRCVPYATPSGGGAVTVNVTQWAYSTYGNTNGLGTPSFCGSLAKKPYAFGVGPGGSAMLRVTVNLTFANSEVARGQAQAIALYETTNGNVPAAGAAEAQAAATSLLQPLVTGGGRASIEITTTTVRCLIVNGSKPKIVPTEQGGF